jgi:PAS domain S-box-containing protein
MQIHKKIITYVGLGILLIVTIVVLSLLDVMNAYTSITSDMEKASQEVRRIEAISREVAAMSDGLRHYATGGDAEYRNAYEAARATVHRMFNDFEMLNLGTSDRKLTASLREDITRLEQKAGGIFLLEDPAGRDRVRAHNLIIELDGLLESMNRDIENHFKEEQALQIRMLADYVLLQKKQVVPLLVAILLLSSGFLVAFGIYIYRSVAVPLNDLWKGAVEISQGNLDYQLKLQGTSDVAQLAERFNEMALKLKRSYTELEKKLLDRTNELAAIDAVALTLSQAGNLKEMLGRSLGKILESLAGLEPRGGVFLCDPGGETLQLVTHEGLSPEFIQQEETIRMGECLCGIAAQTGEILYSEKECTDPRHTSCRDGQNHSHIIIPIKSRGIVLGVIFLYPQKEFTLKPSDLQMLDTIGAQLGMAVENLRFYAEVKESSEKFWDLFENSRDILFTIDAAGTLTAVNKEAETFSGYTKRELVGKSILDFLTPQGAGTAKRMLAGEGATARQLIEFEVIKRDGSRAFVEMSARKLFSQRIPAGYQVSVRDMTEQKLLRAKLLKAERLGAIGEVVITVRHEINNPLTTVIGNTELLIERYGQGDRDLAARLEIILNNALRIAEIVKQLQAIRQDKVVEYVKGVSMTDLKQE